VNQMKTKLIFSPQLAQWLLNNKFTIVDIKPKRDYPNETVFVFEVKEGFLESIKEWLDLKESDGD
jgi:hypothetical protein